MNKKKWFGILLIVCSLVIAILNNTITGAVIGNTTKNYLSLISLGMFFIGILLFLTKDLEKSIQEAIERGVPQEDAKRIFKESNEKVGEGSWVELDTFRIRDTNNPETYPQATSLFRYWGPEKFKGISRSKLNNLYKQGKIGKTHELARGSEKYKIGGSEFKGTISKPPKGSRVLHRHWEISQMYDYEQNTGD